MKELSYGIVAAGCNLTGQLVPYSPIPELMAVADAVVKLVATCFYCEMPAEYSYYRGSEPQSDDPDDDRVGDDFVPACLPCYSHNSGINGIKELRDKLSGVDNG